MKYCLACEYLGKVDEWTFEEDKYEICPSCGDHSTPKDEGAMFNIGHELRRGGYSIINLEKLSRLEDNEQTLLKIRNVLNAVKKNKIKDDKNKERGKIECR